MPNHYTTMAVCSPGYEFNIDDFNERHKESNLCAIVCPMPEVVEEIHSGSYLDHSWRKVTVWRESTVDGKIVRTPVDAPNWYDWATENWGTKWGTYDVMAFDLGGDSSPVLIKFQSAWSAPKILDKIADWLKKTYGFERVEWIGFDPYDDSTKML